jgi:hypothetical protein
VNACGWHCLLSSQEKLGREIERYGNGGTDLECRAIRREVIAINRTPFVIPRQCAQMILVAVDQLRSYSDWITFGIPL